MRSISSADVTTGEFVMTATKYFAVIAGALLATAASAGGDKDHSMKSADQKFERLDSNQDSAISKSEASNDSNLAATFASVDADGDGTLSKTEYTAHLSKSEGNAQRDWSSSSGEE
jgi:hypothetical protein